jgi:hypothetical protein
MTVAPSAASCSAIALPMPRLAPVTSAISPCSDLLIYLPFYIYRRDAEFAQVFYIFF